MNIRNNITSRLININYLESFKCTLSRNGKWFDYNKHKNIFGQKLLNNKFLKTLNLKYDNKI